MESTKFINPQALSSVFVALDAARALQPWAFGFINFVDCTVHAYNYYVAIVNSPTFSLPKL